MTAILTYLAIAMITIGSGITSCAIQSIVVWCWTLTRPTSAPDEVWAKPGQYYRGEMSPAIRVASTEGYGIWKHSTIPPHEHKYHRSDVLGGIIVDIKQIAFAVVLFVGGILLARGWATLPGVGMSLLLAIHGLFAAMYITILVAQADAEYWMENFAVGIARGGFCMSLFGFGVLVIVHIMHIPELVHFLSNVLA